MLSVKCINNKCAEGGLTVGKVYDISLDEVEDEVIYIKINDAGILDIGYDRDKFKYVIKKGD